MLRRIALISCLSVVGCGGSVSSDPGLVVTDAAPDGTADVEILYDVAPSDAPPKPPVACTDCFAGALSWGYDGGLVAWVETSSVEACRTYRHRRDPARSDPPSIACSQPLVDCSAGADVVGIGDVERALNDPDVSAAFGKSPIVFGFDSRPADGSVFRVTYGGRTVDVGQVCADRSPCIATPPGVQRLVNVLQKLDAQELAKGDCKGKFTPTGV